MAITGNKISEINLSSKKALQEIIGIPNTRYFEWTDKTISSTLNLDYTISKEIMDKSILLLFVKLDFDSLWVPVYGPFPTPSATVTMIFRSYTYKLNETQYRTVVRSHTWAGTYNTTSKTFEKVRLYIIQYKQ